MDSRLIQGTGNWKAWIGDWYREQRTGRHRLEIDTGNGELEGMDSRLK
jgi:hypothetical protein